jgi:hypothetical protein
MYVLSNVKFSLEIKRPLFLLQTTIPGKTSGYIKDRVIVRYTLDIVS